MIKYNSKHLESVSENISKLKEYLDRLGETQSPDKEIFWKAVKNIIVKSKEMHQKDIMIILGQEDITDPACSHLKMKFLGGAIAAYDEILGIVDKNEEYIGRATSRITELKEQHEQIKTNIELQDGGSK
jgi:hypothetical protein